MACPPISIKPSKQQLKQKASRPVSSQPPLNSPAQKSTSPRPQPHQIMQHQMRTSALRACSTWSVKNGRMKWIESFRWGWMATSAAKNPEMIALFNRVMLRLKVINCFSYMEMLLKSWIMPNFKRLWFKFRSNMSDLTILLALRTFPSVRDS